MVNYRKLNAVSARSAYPLPNISEILDQLGHSRFISGLDIRSAYWQIKMDEDSKKYTGFVIPGRALFQFNRLTFGLHGAPGTFQDLIDKLFLDLRPYVFAYLDDIVIATADFEKHLRILKELLKRLKAAGLTLKENKCIFCKSEMKYLGYIVTRNGLCMEPEKISGIVNMPRPTTPKAVKRLIGMISWYRRFLKDFSTMIEPLTNLTRKRKKFILSNECKKSFMNVKTALISKPILTCPDYSNPFVLQCDASDVGLGAVLTQEIDREERVISFLSRS